MKIFWIIATTLLPSITNAVEIPVLEIQSESPYFHCTINNGVVNVEKMAGTIKYSKTASYKISAEIINLTASALEAATSTESKFVIHAKSISSGSNKSYLNPIGTDSEQNLVRFMTRICND